MYCRECGTKLDDGAKVCSKCGAPTYDTTYNNVVSYRDRYNYDMVANSIRLSIIIFSIATLCISVLLTLLGMLTPSNTGGVIVIVGLIFVAWSIFVVYYLFNSINKGLALPTWFKICTLIFFNQIVGILILVSMPETYNNQDLD